jgi:hypothetical protein
MFGGKGFIRLVRMAPRRLPDSNLRTHRQGPTLPRLIDHIRFSVFHSSFKSGLL